MGRGIAQVLLRHGYSVLLSDVSPAGLDSARIVIAAGLDRDAEKGRLAGSTREQAMSRLSASTQLDEMSAAEFIIEAVPERFDLKAEVLRRLQPVARPEAFLASNTSSISITRLAALTARPARFCGMHFFNPVPVMKLVEIVSGIETAPEAAQRAKELAISLGKTPVCVNDFPGFISNRVLMPMINEAAFALMEGVADAPSIDAVMKLGMNHPMGPLELADLIGLDVCLDIMTSLYEGFRDSKYRPCPLLEKMVHAGRLGRKTKRGFFEY